MGLEKDEDDDDVDEDDDDVVEDEQEEDFDRASEKSERGVTDCVSILLPQSDCILLAGDCGGPALIGDCGGAPPPPLRIGDENPILRGDATFSSFFIIFG